jgi:hypothetical protein
MAALRSVGTALGALFGSLLGACGGGSGAHDAAPDIDNGTCGSALRFTGDYVNWDNDTHFCGVFGARFQAEQGGGSSMTAPNGRFDLCVPDQPTALVDITPPADLPDCVVDKTQSYPLPGLAVANKQVILAGGEWHGRTFLTGQVAFNASLAQVYVHVDGTPRAVSLELGRAHGQTMAVATNTWAPGNVGHEVFFPDVDPNGGSATLSVDGGAIGTGSIPLAAGKITTLSVIAP